MAFPVLDVLVPSEGVWAPRLRLGVEGIQLLAFALLPHYRLGESLKAVAPVLYATQLPFFDQANFFVLDFARYGGFFWAAFAFVVLCVAVIPPLAATLHRSVASRMLRPLVHVTTSVLYTPLMHAFVSHLVCDGDGNLWPFTAPPAACFVGESIARFVCALVAAMLLFVGTVVANALLVDVDLDSPHPLARSNVWWSTLFVVWKTATIVVFHVLLSARQPLWFGIYLATTALCLALVTCFALPFYHQDTNQHVAGALLVVSATAVTSAISTSRGAADGFFVDMDDATLLLLTLLPATWALGERLAQARVNPDFAGWMRSTIDGRRRPPANAIYFPDGLPEYDQTHPSYRYVVNLIASNAETGDDDDATRRPILTPFLSVVRIATDVEVAARFITRFVQLGRAPNGTIPARMLILGARLFSKGAMRFANSQATIVAFANFIYCQVDNPRATLYLLDQVTISDVDSRYFSHRLNTAARSDLNMRDAAAHRQFTNTKKTFREALKTIADFWNKLLADNSDLMQLVNSATQIGEKRIETLQAFQAAFDVVPNDTSLASRYAFFLEHVAMEPTKAEALNSALVQNSEFKRWSAMRGAKKERGREKSQQGWDINYFLSQGTADGDALGASQSVESSAMRTHWFLTLLFGALLLLAAAGFAIAAAVYHTQLDHSIRNVLAAGQSRALTSHASVLAHITNGTLVTNASGAGLGAALGAAIFDLHGIHGAMTHGTFAPTRQETRKHFRDGRVLMHDAVDVQRTLSPFSFVDAGFNVVERLQRALTPAAEGSSANALPPTDPLFQDVLLWLAPAWNITVTLSVADVNSMLDEGLVTIALLAAVALFSGVALWMTIESNRSQVVAHRASVMSLFSLVPRRDVQDLAKSATLRLSIIHSADEMGDGSGSMAGSGMSGASGSSRGDGGGGGGAMFRTLAQIERDQLADMMNSDGRIEGRDGDKHSDSSDDDPAAGGDAGKDGKTPLVARDNAQSGGGSELSLDDSNRNRSSLASHVLPFVALLACALVGGVASAAIASVTGSTVDERREAALRLHGGLVRRGIELAEALSDADYTLLHGESAATPRQQTPAGIAQRLADVQLGWSAFLHDAALFTEEELSVVPLIRDAAIDAETITSQYLRAFEVFAASPIPQVNRSIRRGELGLGFVRVDAPAERAMLALVFSGVVQEARRRFEATLGVMAKEARDLAEGVERTGAVWVSLGCTAGFAFLALAVCVFSVVVLLRRDAELGHRAPVAVFAFCAMVSVATLVLPLVVLERRVTAIEKVVAEHVELQKWNSSRTELLETAALARDYTQTGSFAAFNQYFVVRQESEGDWEDYDASCSPSDIDAEACRYNVSATVAALQQVEMTALALAARAFRLSADLAAPVATATWDVNTSFDATHVRLLYAGDALLETNSTYDLTMRSPDAMLVIARYGVASARFFDLFRNATGAIDAAVAERVATAQADRAAVADHGLVWAALACFGALLLTCVAFGAWLLLESQQSAMALFSGQQASRIVLRYSFVLIAACVATIVGLVVTSAVRVRATPGNIDTVTALEWVVANAMVATEQWALGSAGPRVVLESSGEAVANAALLDVVLNRFLYRAKDHGYNAVGRHASVDALLFGTKDAVALPPSWDCAFTTNGTFPSASFVQRGAVAAAREFAEAIREILALGIGAASARLPGVRAQYFPTQLLLRHTANTFAREELAMANWWLSLVLIISCVALAIVVLVAFGVVMPQTRFLSKEYRDSLVILRMMPTKIREGVPAIRQFIERTIVQDAQVEAGNSESTYTAPIIVINHQGIVIKFNSAAEDTFGYASSEVVGNNVSMLMPDEFAVHHDQYIRNYLTTGIRKVLGQRREVVGKKKNDELFPLSLHLKQFNRSGGDIVFIGFVEDYRQRVHLRRLERINNVVRHMATVPIISIDTLGTITAFNRSAEQTFGYSGAEVLGENVKMLMPDRFSKHHDTYLANYLRTKEKHVIDTTRSVPGLNKNNTEFALEISVKEIKHDDGSTSTYLGFVRDRTEALVLQEQHEIDNEVSNLCPVPIIGIDAAGIILKWNTAACATFGWEASEVVNRNIKLLMPANIAVNHDSYLEKYRRTKRRTIVGTERTITAVHKDGHTLPIRIFVGESQHDGRPSDFLGYLINIKDELEHLKQTTMDKAVMNECLIPIVTINAEGTILFANLACTTTFGYGLHELKDTNVKILMDPEIGGIHDEKLQQYRDTKKRRILDTGLRATARRKSGEIFPVEIKVDEVVDEQGSSTFIGFIRDRKKEMELERKQLINRAFFDVCCSPVVVSDARGTIEIFSPEAENLFGWSEQEIRGKNVKLLMPESLASQHDGFLSRYVKTGEKRIIGQKGRFLEGVSKKGVRIPVELALREIRSPSGNRSESSIVACFRDLSRAGESQEIDLRNTTIAGLSPIPFIQISQYGSVQKFNTAAENVFGWSASEIIGMNIKVIMPESIAAHHDAYLAKYRSTRQANVIGKRRTSFGQRKNGQQFHVELTVSEVEVHDGGENYYIAFVEDIETRIELADANAVSGVISDLSPTPLIAITDRGEILKFNRAAGTALGYSENEVIGKNISFLIYDPKISEGHDNILRRYREANDATRAKSSVVNQSRAVEAKDALGNRVPMEINVKQMRLADGSTTYYSNMIDLREGLARENAAKLTNAVLATAPLPIVAINKAGIITLVNPATAKMFGYSEAEVIGKNVKMLMPENIAAQHDGFLKAYLTSGVAHVIDTTRQLTGKHKDGHPLHLELSVRKAVGPDGEPSFLGYARDRSAEMAVEMAAATHNMLIRCCPVPLITINDIGSIAEFSPAAVDFFGYDVSEVHGKNIKMLMPEEYETKHDDYLKRYRETGEKHIIGTTRTALAKKANGMTCPVRIGVRELGTEGSGAAKRTNFVGYIEDASGQAEIAQATNAFEAIKDMMPIPLITISDHGHIRSWSKASEALFGYTAAEVLKKNIKILCPTEVARKHDGFLKRYRETGEKHVIGSSRNVDALHKDGSLVPVEIFIDEYLINDVHYFMGFVFPRKQELETERLARVNSAVTDLTENPVVSIDEDGTITSFSRAAEIEFGHSAASILGMNVNILMPHEIAKEHDGYLARYRKDGIKRVVDKNRQVQGITKDGKPLRLELLVREVQKKGLTRTFVAFIFNIAKREEEELNARILSEMEKMMADPVIVINEFGKVISFTSAAERLFGYTAQEVVNDNVSKLMPIDVASKHNGYLRRYLETGEKRVIDKARDVTGRRKNGSQVPLTLHVREIRLSDNTQRYYLAVIVDRSAEAEVAIGRQVGDSLVLLNPEAIVTINGTGTIRSFNRAAEDLFGFKAGHVIGKNVTILMPDEIAKEHDGYLSRRAANKDRESKVTRLVTGETMKGVKFACELTVAEIRDQDGQILYVGYFRT